MRCVTGLLASSLEGPTAQLTLMKTGGEWVDGGSQQVTVGDGRERNSFSSLTAMR